MATLLGIFDQFLLLVLILVVAVHKVAGRDEFQSAEEDHDVDVDVSGWWEP